MATSPKTSPKTKGVVVRQLNVEKVFITVKGTSALITNKWSEKARTQMLRKQTGEGRVGKEKKNPQEQFEQSLYVMPDGNYGFPAVAFKAAAVRAGTYADYAMTFLRGAFHVEGDLVALEGEPQMREDMVRLQGKTADVRFRGEFLDWTAKVPVVVNTSAITVEEVAQLFKIAGFAVGIGEWRPEKNGQNGRFDVINVEG